MMAVQSEPSGGDVASVSVQSHAYCDPGRGGAECELRFGQVPLLALLSSAPADGSRANGNACSAWHASGEHGKNALTTHSSQKDSASMSR